MRSKLRRFIKPYADFVHVVSGHQRTTLDGFELTKTAAVVKYEPRCEKTGPRGFRPGLTQTGLYNQEDG